MAHKLRCTKYARWQTNTRMHASQSASVRWAKAACHHHTTSVNGLGQMITTAAWANATLKWAHMHRHTHAFNTPRQRCAEAQSIRQRGRGRDSTFIYWVYFTCFSWFIIYESISLYAHSIQTCCFFSPTRFYHAPASMSHDLLGS